jgi:hypothetical protein
LAQKSWHSEFLVGVGRAKMEQTYEKLPVNSFCLEFNKLQNGHFEKRLSFTKEFGIGLRYNSLSWESSGLGGSNSSSGAYFYSMLNTSFLLQFLPGENYIVQIGPCAEINLIGYESSKFDWWRLESSENGFRQIAGNSEKSGFNRNYFNQPYYGLNFRLLSKPKDTSVKSTFYFRVKCF